MDDPQVIPQLAGSKCAIQFRRKIYISPAMGSLLEGLDADEKKAMMKNFKILVVSDAEFMHLQIHGTLPRKPG